MIRARLKRKLLDRILKLAKQPTVEENRTSLHNDNETRLDIWRVNQMKRFTDTNSH